MPLTVGQVAALPDLGLSVRTVEADLDRVVRWVAVSEHADPTPWLDGGDLLLTTGMSITGDESQAAEYVDRLVAADVAALGFGVGLSHQSVPAALVAAAEAAGLPLLEVPQPIPFVALSKAVSRLLTDEEYAESAASFESQRRLIRAALAEPAAAGVIPVLARHVGGFALHLDQAGACRGRVSDDVGGARGRPGRRGGPAAVPWPAGFGGRGHGRRARGDPADRGQGRRRRLPGRGLAPAPAVGRPGRDEPRRLGALVARLPARGDRGGDGRLAPAAARRRPPSTACRRTCWPASACPTSAPGGRSGWRCAA